MPLPPTSAFSCRPFPRLNQVALLLHVAHTVGAVVGVPVPGREALEAEFDTAENDPPAGPP